MWRVRAVYLRRHPRMIALWGTFAFGIVLPVPALLTLVR
jgi:hypothetical protein